MGVSLINKGNMIKSATVELNTECNNSCVWCYNESKRNQTSILSESLFETILSHLLEEGCEVLLFTGGEPTLHPQLPLFIKKSVDVGIKRVFVVTNGKCIPSDFFDTLSDYSSAVCVNVSIHGAESAIHDKIVQSDGSFDLLLHNILNYQKNKFVVNAQITLCKENQTNLVSTLFLLAEFNVKNVLINFCQKPIGTKIYYNGFLSINEFCESVSNAVEKAPDDMNIEIGPYIPSCVFPEKIRSLIQEKKISMNYGCGVVGKEIIFDPTGNILLCPHLPDIKTGNVLTIENMSSFLSELNCKTSAVRKYPKEECNKCTLIETCYRGGCPVLWATGVIK